MDPWINLSIPNHLCTSYINSFILHPPADIPDPLYDSNNNPSILDMHSLIRFRIIYSFAHLLNVPFDHQLQIDPAFIRPCTDAYLHPPSTSGFPNLGYSYSSYLCPSISYFSIPGPSDKLGFPYHGNHTALSPPQKTTPFPLVIQ